MHGTRECHSQHYGEWPTLCFGPLSTKQLLHSPTEKHKGHHQRSQPGCVTQTSQGPPSPPSHLPAPLHTKSHNIRLAARESQLPKWICKRLCLEGGKPPIRFSLPGALFPLSHRPGNLGSCGWTPLSHSLTTHTRTHTHTHVCTHTHIYTHTHWARSQSTGTELFVCTQNKKINAGQSALPLVSSSPPVCLFAVIIILPPPPLPPASPAYLHLQNHGQSSITGSHFTLQHQYTTT